jgi:hypothetical protein
VEAAPSDKKFAIGKKVVAKLIRNPGTAEKVVFRHVVLGMEVHEAGLSLDAYANISQNEVIEVAVSPYTEIMVLVVIHLTKGKITSDLNGCQFRRNRGYRLRVQEDREDQKCKPGQKFSKHRKTSPM